MLLWAEMTSTEWGILVAAACTLLVPSVASWVLIYTKLTLFENTMKLGREATTDKIEQLDFSTDIEMLWQYHHQQEGRLYSHDVILARLVDRLALEPPPGFEPKRPPESRPPTGPLTD